MGASIFYHSPPESETQKSDDVSALDSELKSGAKNVKEAEKEQQNLSSLVILSFSKLFLFIYVFLCFFFFYFLGLDLHINAFHKQSDSH